MTPLVSRRAMLAVGAALPLAGQAAAETVREEHQHLMPRMRMNVANTDNDEKIGRALAAKVKTLGGLDPARFAQHFDWGQTTKLSDGRTLREWQLVAEEREIEIAPGIFYPAWTYNGAVPGPTLRCREGDRLRIHLVNRSQSDHTLHFHGVHPATVDGVNELVRPGESFAYEFDAEPAGLHLYHCHTPPVGMHISRGLYGAFIVDPQQSRPADREIVLVAAGWDIDFDERNEIYAVNGGANFYRDNPIGIRVGERVRFYFVNMLEHDAINSLHLHANFFDVYRTTRADEKGERSDIVTLCQADRRILEFSYRFPGLYMFHAHQSRLAERGWMAHLEVSA